MSGMRRQEVCRRTTVAVLSYPGAYRCRAYLQDQGIFRLRIGSEPHGNRVRGAPRPPDSRQGNQLEELCALREAVRERPSRHYRPEDIAEFTSNREIVMTRASSRLFLLLPLASSGLAHWWMFAGARAVRSETPESLPAVWMCDSEIAEEPLYLHI